jgi:hypothetical protein
MESPKKRMATCAASSSLMRLAVISRREVFAPKSAPALTRWAAARRWRCRRQSPRGARWCVLGARQGSERASDLPKANGGFSRLFWGRRVPRPPHAPPCPVPCPWMDLGRGEPPPAASLVRSRRVWLQCNGVGGFGCHCPGIAGRQTAKFFPHVGRIFKAGRMAAAGQIDPRDERPYRFTLRGKLNRGFVP